MIVPNSRTSETAMSYAVSLAQTLERKERARGILVAQARLTIARKLKIGYGTFERLVRGRVKRIDADIRDKLQALLIREIEGEIARLTHDLEIARRSGLHLASLEVSEIETHLEKARAILNRT